MSRNPEYWTPERVERLEEALARWQHQDDIYARTFLNRLKHCRTIEEKRALIVNDLLAVIAQEQVVRLWEGAETTTRLALRDLITAYLYREQIIESTPTDEPDTQDEEAERQRLASLFGQGKPVSEIVIEDRGPR
jgi:hypothetical protein